MVLTGVTGPISSCSGANRNVHAACGGAWNDVGALGSWVESNALSRRSEMEGTEGRDWRI